MTTNFFNNLEPIAFAGSASDNSLPFRHYQMDPEDLILAHVGGMDCCARALLAAARMLEEQKLQQFVEQRYSGWSRPQAEKMLNGDYSLDDISAYVINDNVNPQPRSGKQEYMENLVNRYC